MKVILFQPQIPQNTGNIIRTCSAAKSDLVLVRPLGFSTSNRRMKRAGLDYFEDVFIQEIDELNEHITPPFYFFSSKAKKSYLDVSYSEESSLIFGNETSGLPDSFFETWPESFVRIPMKEGARCLNLSNAVAVALFEARRQIGFTLKETAR